MLANIAVLGVFFARVPILIGRLPRLQIEDIN